MKIIILFITLTIIAVVSPAADQPQKPVAPKAEETKPAAPHGPKPPLAKGVRDIGVEEYDKLKTGGSVVLLDVRTPKEFAAGHIPGAVNIDVSSPDFEKKAAALDPNKTYLVNCAAGVRSAKACNAMSALKFPKLFNLEPGFKGWEKSGKPVEK